MSKRLTPKGYRLLKAEYENLLHVERPKVVRGITNAAAEGDRSENAEYIYGKKHLREIDKRLQYLAQLLKEVQVICLEHRLQSTVSFGHTVVVKDDQDEFRSFRIVGEGETEFHDRAISERSPVAKALLGKRIGDIVEIVRPKGVWEVEICELLNSVDRDQ
ncbi:MAG: GreA/GreB family elongation factor [Myxococcaceae bacterium]|nr:GreA/GreB family elongation factor [Myxococcaceae bacterium]